MKRGVLLHGRARALRMLSEPGSLVILALSGLIAAAFWGGVLAPPPVIWLDWRTLSGPFGPLVVALWLWLWPAPHDRGTTCGAGRHGTAARRRGVARRGRPGVSWSETTLWARCSDITAGSSGSWRWPP